MPARFVAVPFGDLRRRLDQSRIYDWAMRCPLIVYSVVILSRDVLDFSQEVVQDPALFEQFDGGMVIAMLARISQWMFIVLLSIQPLFRLRPIAKSDEILPRAAALLAVCGPLMFLLLERAPPNLVFNLTAVVVSLLANVMTVVTASFLGRSLSVMPEARRLVQSGPYALVRHPLYLCEILGVSAVVLLYRSPPALGLLLLVIALQLARARWEEGVLARSLPDFAAYRARTAFLLPPHPLRFLATFVADPAARRRTLVVVAVMIGILALLATVLPRLVA